MPFDLTAYLREKQIFVEERLAFLLSEETTAPASLLEAMRYSLLAPGKRLRPILVFMACQTTQAVKNKAWPAACAVEMIHTYSLIHDDLPAMDDDDLRRGLPTCHKKFGEAMAILAGDALLTMAFQVLAENCQPMTAALSCAEMARGSGAAGMVGGQVDDLSWEADTGARADATIARLGKPHTAEALEGIHAQKTGALFRSCLRLGVLAGQGETKPDADLLSRLDEFGKRFGLVFQITDDLLDVEGHADVTGKRVNKDAALGKLTYPSLLGVPESRRRAELLGKEALAAIAPLGESAQPLAALMQFVLQRNR